MNPYDLPACIANTWFKRLGIRTVEAIPAGFSGAEVLRCTDAHGESYALKRWPIGTTPERVCEVHYVVSQARQRGCEFLPHLVPTSSTSTLVVHENECWEMSTWIIGETLPFDATPHNIATGAAAIARFHQATFGMIRPSFVSRNQPQHSASRIPSPTITTRLRRLEQLRSEMPRALAAPHPVGLSQELSEAIENARLLLHQRWTFTAPELCRELNSRLAYTVDTQYVLRDIHREHILFATSERDASKADGASFHIGLGEIQPRAIIDFDAVQFDCPGVDLARWVGSFRGFSGTQHGLLDAAVAGYKRNWRFSEDQIALTQTLLRVSPWVNLGNWVTWIVLGTRKFENDELAIANRISELLTVLTAAK